MSKPLKHWMCFIPGNYHRTGFSLCGIRQEGDMAKFTSQTSRITCQECRRIKLLRMAEAKARNEVSA